MAFLCLGNLLNMPLFQGLYRYDWAVASAFIAVITPILILIIFIFFSILIYIYFSV